jgi:DNA-binding Lrp family transcriptional regulator
MCTAEEKFLTPLSATEYRLLDILCLLSKDSMVDATTSQLAEYAQCSEESIRRALRRLEAANLVQTTRTKRNLGKFSFSKYTLTSPSHKIVDLASSPSHKTVGWQPEPSHKIVGSTAGTSKSANISTTSNTETTNKANKTTSYLVPKGTKGRKEVILVNKWSEDDDIGGFGLFDNELEAKKPSAKVSKRDPKTRHLRPQEEWTAADVASEFSSRLYKLLPGIPNLVNTNSVRGALARMRKQYDTNALIELEIMKMFFEDSWVTNQGKDNPAFIPGRFLKMFANNFDQALKNLGLPARSAPSEHAVSPSIRVEFLYASDGEQFDNSIPGRLALQKYEESLRRNNGV